MFDVAKSRNNIDVLLNNKSLKDGGLLDKETMEFLIGLSYDSVEGYIFRLYACTIRDEFEKRGIYCHFKSCENYEMRCEPQNRNAYVTVKKMRKSDRIDRKAERTLSKTDLTCLDDKERLTLDNVRNKCLNRLFAKQSVLARF